MKHIFYFFIWIAALQTAFAAAPIRRTLTCDGHEREYLLYVPDMPDGELRGLVVGLHGFNSSMTTFFDYLPLLDMADSLGYALVAPQALPEQVASVLNKAKTLSDISGEEVRLDAVWGCGLEVNLTTKLFGVDIPLVRDTLNKRLDDVGFINQLINNLLSEYKIDDRNIFMVGTSMGGYMTYQFALLAGERLAGIVPIVGTMGTGIRGLDRMTPPLPVCDFHSLTDEVVPYAGSHTVSGFTYTLGRPKREVIGFWVANNGCGEPQTVDFPDANGIKVKKFVYSNPQNDNEVIHYQADGASHGYVFAHDNGDSMDYGEEIRQFISDHSAKLSGGIETIELHAGLHFFPNPVVDRIYFSVDTGSFAVHDLTGRVLITGDFHGGSAQIKSLVSGIYAITIVSGTARATMRLVKK
jgi:poly(3-hydroxybutyrate) depolymerase